MRRVVPVLAELHHHPTVHVHVGKETHNLGGDQLLLSQPRRILDGLLDIIALEVRVPFKNLLEASVADPRILRVNGTS
jgi:hypothetical protein